MEELYEKTMSKTAKARGAPVQEEEGSRLNESIASKYKSSFGSMSSEGFEDFKKEENKGAARQEAPAKVVKEQNEYPVAF